MCVLDLTHISNHFCAITIFSNLTRLPIVCDLQSGYKPSGDSNSTYMKPTEWKKTKGVVKSFAWVNAPKSFELQLWIMQARFAWQHWRWLQEDGNCQHEITCLLIVMCLHCNLCFQGQWSSEQTPGWIIYTLACRVFRWLPLIFWNISSSL